MPASLPGNGGERGGGARSSSALCNESSDCILLRSFECMDVSSWTLLLVPCSVLVQRFGAADGGCRLEGKLGMFEGYGCGTDVSRGDTDDTKHIARYSASPRPSASTDISKNLGSMGTF
jgi:hypothetical protein